MHNNDANHRLLILFLNCLLLLAGSAFAAEKVLDSSQVATAPASLAPYFAILEDSALALTVDDMQQPAVAQKFKPGPAAAEALSLGYTRSAYWLRLALRNSTDAPLERMLEINYAMLSSVRFYQPMADGSYQVISTGGEQPFATRPYPNRNFVFPLAQPAHSSQVYYLRLQSIDAILVPARLWTPQAFHVYERNDYNIQSLYFGMALAMILFNLLLYFAMRDISYLLYVIFVFFAALTLAAQNGLAHEFLWPQTSHWSNMANFIGFAIAQVSFLVFMRHMLLTRLVFPAIDRLIKFFIGIQLLAALVLSVAAQTFTQAAVLLNLVLALMTLWVGLYCAFKRQRSAYFFVIAFAMLILGGLLTILRALGVLPTSFITMNALQLGSAMEMVLLAFALADRFNLIRREKAQAQQVALDAQRQLVETLQSSERELEARVEERTAELRIAATAFDAHECTVVTDADGLILKVNPAFYDITGYSSEDAVGQKMSILRSGKHEDAFYAAMWATIKSTGAWQGEIWNRRKNGEIYPKWLTISAVKADDGTVTHYVGTQQDITARKVAEERIAELAFFDPLTRLPNRTLLQDRLKQALTASNRSGNHGAVLFLDLDQFKTLNDTLGHEKGDALLQQVAQRLVALVREGDTVARPGGDEFVVILANMSDSAEVGAKQTEAVAKKILADLDRVYRLGNIDFRNTASIGASLFHKLETPVYELLKQAELAMYKSKASGRNSFHFFDYAMERAVVERVALESELRKSIEENRLFLHYQPQVAGERGAVTGAEVLVRWQHPQRGMMLPAEFIPLAEETGIILPLGRWVMKTACAQLAVWAAHPALAQLTLAVNVSAQQFRQPDFVAQVAAVLKSSGASPHKLKLELTESLLVKNVEDIIEKMSLLKAFGVSFSLDDFGTGYSSLSYLKRLPLDQLKIDQSFVNDILADSSDAAIAKTIVTLAHSLGLEVIAEGVETAAQRDFLASSGCHAYQGYFYSRPLALNDFEQYTKHHRLN